MSALAWIDGEFVERAVVAVTDRAFSHGVGLFETLGAFAGELPLWRRHVARLARSAAVMGIACDVPRGLLEAARELLVRCDRRDGILRITLSAGGVDLGAGDVTPSAGHAALSVGDVSLGVGDVSLGVGDAAPRWVLSCRPRVDLDRPLRLAIARARRGEHDPTSALKTTSRAFYELALGAAREVGADDAVLCGRGDELLETTTGNLFCAIGGELRTPPLDGRVLPGVARAVLLDALGDAVRETPVHLAELRSGDGVWVTNAVYGPRRASLGEATPNAASETVEKRLTAVWRDAVS